MIKAKLLPSMASLSVALLVLTGCGSNEEPSASASAPTAEELAKAKAYPLTTCLISDEALDSMGGEVVYIHAGQQVKFCCKDCIKEFTSAPEKYLAKLVTPKAPEAPKVPEAPEAPKL